MTCAFFNSCLHNYDYATGDDKHTEAQPLSRLYIYFIRIFACDTQNLNNPFCADSIRYRFIMRVSTYMMIEYVLVCECICIIVKRFIIMAKKDTTINSHTTSMKHCKYFRTVYSETSSE